MDVVFQFRSTANASVLTTKEMRKYMALFFDQNLEGLADRKYQFLQRIGATKLRFDMPPHQNGSNCPTYRTLRMASEDKAKLHEVAGTLGLSQQATFELVMYHAVEKAGDMAIDFEMLVDVNRKPKIFQPTLLNRYGR